MKQAFLEMNLRKGTLDMIGKANQIISEYQRQGFKLTLRQLYYQFVARDLIANKIQEYKRLGSIINDGRLAGLIDWDAIEDRLRVVEKINTWDSPEEIVEACAQQYKENLWADQPRTVEVWIEKDALVGVIEPVCRRWRVPYLACRGNASQSCLYEAGNRLRDASKPLILHLGDHDPSGMDMTRDNRERMSMFTLGNIELKRIALNMDQIEQYDPPPNPVKESDSRASGYQQEFGDSSWELDALEPTVIDRLIEREITAVVDRSRWDAAKAVEDAGKARLRQASSWLANGGGDGLNGEPDEDDDE